MTALVLMWIAFKYYGISITGLFSHSQNEGQENLVSKVTILGKALRMMVKILKSFFLMGGQRGES